MPKLDRDDQITCYEKTGPSAFFRCRLTCGRAQRLTRRLEVQVKASAKIFGLITVTLLASSCVMEMHPADSAPPPQASVTAGTGGAAPSTPSAPSTIVRSGPSAITAPTRRQNAPTGGAASTTDSSAAGAANTSTSTAAGGTAAALK